MCMGGGPQALETRAYPRAATAGTRACDAYP